MPDTTYVGVNHDLRSNNGGTIYMPRWYAGESDDAVWGNLDLPNVHAIGDTQLYPRGTAYREGERTFFYGRYTSDTNLKTCGYLMVTNALHVPLADGIQSGAIDSNSIVITHAAAAVVNFYAGGFIGIKGSLYTSRYIIASSVMADSLITLTVEGTLPSALVTTDDYALMANPYREFEWYSAADTRPYVGVSMITNVVSEYAWLQTWGVHACMHPFNSWEGGDGNQMGFYAYHGSVQQHPDSTSSVVNVDADGATQQAGVMASGTTEVGGTDYSVLNTVFLMIRKQGEEMTSRKELEQLSIDELENMLKVKEKGLSKKELIDKLAPKRSQAKRRGGVGSCSSSEGCYAIIRV